MINIITPKMSFTLPNRIEVGAELTASEAEFLQGLMCNRLRALIAKWLDKGMSLDEVQVHLAHELETFAFTEKLGPADPVTLEAIRLAQGIVRQRLSAAGLEADEVQVQAHAEQVARLESVQARAKEIIALRLSKAEAALDQAKGQAQGPANA